MLEQKVNLNISSQMKSQKTCMTINFDLSGNTANTIKPISTRSTLKLKNSNANLKLKDEIAKTPKSHIELPSDEILKE